jgi:hypothetical protein
MRQISRHRRRATWLCLSLVAATACAKGAASPPANRPAASSVGVVSPSPGDTWLAALRVEADPDALDADTRDLNDVLGEALIVSPASCLRGLPADVDATAYVLGVQASTQAELRTLVARTHRDPAFEVLVQVLCID